MEKIIVWRSHIGPEVKFYATKTITSDGLLEKNEVRVCNANNEIKMKKISLIARIKLVEYYTVAMKKLADVTLFDIDEV